MRGFDTDTVLTGAVIQAAIDAGYVCAGRYLKNMQRSEIEAAQAFVKQSGWQGFWSIAEGRGDAETIAGGYARGFADGADAAGQANALGQPHGSVVFMTVDFPAEAAQTEIVRTYLDGFDHGLTLYRAGVYGDGAVLAALRLVRDIQCYLAGAKGWPGYADFVASGKAAIVQSPTVQLAEIFIDPCEVHDPSVLWMPASAPAVPASGPDQYSAAYHIPPPLVLQAALKTAGIDPGPLDGIYGPQTAAALAAFYER